MNSTSSDPIEYIIRPKSGWFDIDLKGLVEHRDLLFLLVRRDLVAKYKQTILGPLWHVIQPLMMAFVFSAVFSRVAVIGTEGAPRILFYLSGLLSWNYFTQTLSATSSTFNSNSALFGKVYFPRLVMPLAVAMSNLVSLGIQLGVFLLFFIVYSLSGKAQTASISPAAIVFLPLLVLQTAALSLGCGLCLSSLTVRYRDLQHAIPFVLTIWMFASPVLYPISQAPSVSHWAFFLNPMAVVIESTRRVLLGAGSVSPSALAFSIIITTIFLFAGLLLFHQAERTATDTV